MKLRLFSNLAWLFVAITAPAQKSLHFKTTVHSGERYTHAIGHGLYLALDQVDGGDWNFQVRPARDSPENYADCLGSPVLHGPETTDLSAWRFAPGADAGWAMRVPVEKQLSFVKNDADHTYECSENSAVYESFQQSQKEGKSPDYSGLPHYKPRPLAHGSVDITSVVLKSGLSGRNSEFQEITMMVRIRFRSAPKPAPPSTP